MFKIKMLCHDLVSNDDSGNRKIISYIDYIEKEFSTVDEAIIVMNQRIADELKSLNEYADNDFKVTYNHPNALAVVQCWAGKESQMSEAELEGDRDCYDVTAYDIVWLGNVYDDSLPEKYIN